MMDNRNEKRPSMTCAFAEQISSLQKELFHIWCFLSSEGMNEEALEYLKEHSHDPVPFELNY